MPRKAPGRPRREAPKEGKGSRRSKTFAKNAKNLAWDDRFIEIAKNLVRDQDLSDMEIAQYFGVSSTTLYRWKREVPKFRNAFKRGEELQKQAVQAALFKRAVGYSHRATKVLQNDGIPVYAEYEEVFAPDVSAQKLWLQGNMPEKFGDKLELQNFKPVNFIIEGLYDEASKPKEIASGRKPEPAIIDATPNPPPAADSKL